MRVPLSDANAAASLAVKPVSGHDPIPIPVACLLIAGSVHVLTRAFRSVAPRLGFGSPPNDRDLHQGRTPRGGGIAIVIGASAGWWWLGSHEPLPLLLAGGLAMMGLWDDRHRLPPLPRLAAQLAVVSMLAWSIPRVSTHAPHPAMLLVAVPCLMWFINLFNFMDGSDGLATVETLFIAIGSLLLMRADPGKPADATHWAILAAACVGFLPWNLPRARVFLGDAGSTWLGLVIGCVLLADGIARPDLAPALCLLPGAFVTDASVCLARRMMQGKHPFEAHRCHAYQRRIQRTGSHWNALAWLLLVNLIPAIGAVACLMIPSGGWLIAGVAYLILAVIMWQAGSGLAAEGP